MYRGEVVRDGQTQIKSVQLSQNKQSLILSGGIDKNLFQLSEKDRKQKSHFILLNPKYWNNCQKACFSTTNLNFANQRYVLLKIT